tara:strand:- start:373 stop:543 length:171 start_codon:yes stop_codon:yes gene_type:complete
MTKDINIKDTANRLYQESIKDIEDSIKNLQEASRLHGKALQTKEKIVEKFHKYLDI